MRLTTRIRALIVASFLLAFTLLPHQPALAAGPAQIERVLIISVDGLRPDAITPERAPNISALAKSGSFSWDAHTVNPPITLPSHASMLSGVDIPVHQITWNNYDPSRGTIQVPTVFSIAHDAGYKTVMVYGKAKFWHLNAPGTVDVADNMDGASDIAIGQQAAQRAGEGFGVMFVHLPGVDRTGHSSGWMSPTYLTAVTLADQAIGEVLAGLEAAGLDGSTLVIVTADHGGAGYGHGQDTPTDRMIPWIASGPGVNGRCQVVGAVSTMDTAASTLYALGLNVPADWEGQPVMDAFTGKQKGKHCQHPTNLTPGG